MIGTVHLQPPGIGPRSNPMLFGVAEALAEMLPLTAASSFRGEPTQGVSPVSSDARTDRADAILKIRADTVAKA